MTTKTTIEKFKEVFEKAGYRVIIDDKYSYAEKKVSFAVGITVRLDGFCIDSSSTMSRKFADSQIQANLWIEAVKLCKKVMKEAE